MSRPIRFYTDEHVSGAIVRGMRIRGVDVLTVAQAGMLSATDGEYLALALREGRVVFTQDDDFLRLAHAGVGHAGIVYAPQHTPVGHVVRGLMLIVQVLDAEDMVGHVEFL
jgi:uncharacterized protein with PIN domain